MTKKALQIRDKTIFDGVFVKYILKFLFLAWFKVFGWKTTAVSPKGAGITIAAPHTSNWDIFYAMAAAIVLDIKMYFSIKDSWCRMPVVGPLMLWMGGIPIDRSSTGKGQVALIKEFVDKHKGADHAIFFLFTPEGTRGKVDKWKTGFYHVAQDCGLPIFLAQVDYRTKVSGVFHTYELTDNKENDVAAIQAAYKSIHGRFTCDQYPAYTGPVPEISEIEAAVMRAMFSIKNAATKAEIAAKAHVEELSSKILDALVVKGILESTKQANGSVSYGLTLAGSGCLLHAMPSLS